MDRVGKGRVVVLSFVHDEGIKAREAIRELRFPHTLEEQGREILIIIPPFLLASVRRRWSLVFHATGGQEVMGQLLPLRDRD